MIAHSLILLFRYVTLTLIPVVLSTMSTLRKEMEKYRDIDEDELLKKLSEEELQRLEDELEELDPDVSSEYKVHNMLLLSLFIFFLFLWAAVKLEVASVVSVLQCVCTICVTFDIKVGDTMGERLHINYTFICLIEKCFSFLTKRLVIKAKVKPR